jgi:hypothetical protein
VSETVSNKYPLFQAFNEHVNAIDIVEQADCGSFSESLALLEMLRGNTAAAKELLTDYYRSWDRRVPDLDPHPPVASEPAQWGLEGDERPGPPVASEPAPEPIEEPPASALPGVQTDMFGSATPRPPAKLSGVASRIRGRK